MLGEVCVGLDSRKSTTVVTVLDQKGNRLNTEGPG